MIKRDFDVESAYVTSHYDILRKGKGFSLEEIDRATRDGGQEEQNQRKHRRMASLTPTINLLRRYHIPIDEKRDSFRDWNVFALDEILDILKHIENENAKPSTS